MYPFPSFEPVPHFKSGSFWPVYRFLRRQIRWSDIYISLRIFQFVVSHTVKGFPDGSDGKEFACIAGDLVQSLAWKGFLEEDMATHSSILAWRVPMDSGVTKTWT